MAIYKSNTEEAALVGMDINTIALILNTDRQLQDDCMNDWRNA